MLICDSSPTVRNLILVKKFVFVVTYFFNPRMHIKPFWELKLMLFHLSGFVHSGRDLVSL